MLFREGARCLASALTEFLLRRLGPSPNPAPAVGCPECICRFECLDIQVYLCVVVSGGVLVAFVVGLYCGRQTTAVKKRALSTRPRDD